MAPVPVPHHGGAMSAAVDLASRWLGGGVVAASDESFGFKENLLVPQAADFVPGRYDHRGEIVDGWETRRRRGEPGHDWAVVRLGAPGVVRSVDVDTSFFTGNYPPRCRIEACGMEGHPGVGDLTGPDAEWVEIVPLSPLTGDAHNVFPVADPRRFTHVRLSIHPDGGVARLRVIGEVVPDPRQWDGLTVDLASQEHGGLVVASSDDFYTSAELLNRPGRARTMGEGWETSRRRDSGHDFAVVRLAATGRLRQIVVDTAHFKYNATAEVELHGHVPGVGSVPQASGGADGDGWFPLTGRLRIQPDTRHVFTLPEPTAPVSAVRVDAYPDGGISRVRLVGVPEPASRREAGLRWFNALPEGQAASCLAHAGLSPETARRVLAARPLGAGLSELPAGGAGVDVLAAWLTGPG
ncbi:allantoicase [Microbispora corallina]|uniref:Probable allantoicase n=1 Tax=Microbispora corallina TaxID=83302 RepID=A0ABQ4FYH4_9ACTN|nr:allantoicase [Microbispora corallina]GIH39874.1 putative allantoicase [Microbispora corallina]